MRNAAALYSVDHSGACKHTRMRWSLLRLVWLISHLWRPFYQAG
jgi:hypothetical protein